jgi:predicted RNase H-like HicB family nuclease
MKLPKLTAVIEREDDWFVATCPELGVASQGRTIEDAEGMLKKAVELLLEEADDTEIARRLNRGAKVTSLEPAHAYAAAPFRPGKSSIFCRNMDSRDHGNLGVTSSCGSKRRAAAERSLSRIIPKSDAGH